MSAECFECPKCHARSYNANDIQHRYCGRCHAFQPADPGEPIKVFGWLLAFAGAFLVLVMVVAGFD